MQQKHEDVVTLVCHATSFSETLEHDMMKNLFDIKSAEESDVNGNNIISTSINCKACDSKGKEHKNICKGIQVDDKEYKQVKGTKQPRWFIDYKSALVKHLVSSKHTVAAEEPMTLIGLLNDCQLPAYFHIFIHHRAEEGGGPKRAVFSSSPFSVSK